MKPYLRLDDPDKYTAYLSELERFSRLAKANKTLTKQYWKALFVYCLQRLIWGFIVLPSVILVWLPLLLVKFNLVLLTVHSIPLLENFTSSTANVQAFVSESILLGWLAVGSGLTCFHLVISPFNSPIKEAIKLHMQAWELVQQGRAQKPLTLTQDLESDKLINALQQQPHILKPD